MSNKLNKVKSGKIKVVILTVIFILTVVSVAEAQVIHDPYSSIYKDIDIWTVQGYITKTLPMIRPYPLQVLDEFLADVIENGNDEAAQKAQRYRDALLIGNGPRNSGTALYANQTETGGSVIHAGVTGSIEALNDDLTVLGAPFVDGTLKLKDWITGSFSMHVYASTRTPDSGFNVPETYSPYPDMMKDSSEIGPFNILQNWNSSLTIGTSEIYLQSGLMRTSVGPFYDNGIVVGPQAPKAGHFTIAYRQPKWSFEKIWLELTASDTIGEERFSGKHLVSHYFNFRPVPALEFAFFETMVFGPNIEPMYLIPFNQFFAGGALSDFGGNSFMGLLVRWFCVPDLQIMAQVYVDDLHFNDLIRFKFNTKYEVAGEIGFLWAPKNGPIKSLSLDYTIVTPYTYTHMYSLDSQTYDSRYPSQSNYTGPQANYQDYSHAGKNLGPNLNPNSDRVNLRASWKALYNIDLGFIAYFTRHGNASENRIKEGKMDEKYHKGDIFDDGNNDGKFSPGSIAPDESADYIGEDRDWDNNYSQIRFLTQSVIESKLAAGITLSWYIPTKFGEITFNAEYIAEYGWNRGLFKGNDSLLHYWAVGGTFRF